jgi:hypothetical protein
MSKKLKDFIPYQKEDYFTTEGIAWKLLMDTTISDENKIVIFSEDSSVDTTTNLLTEFETLITIYMEMIYGLVKINYLANSQDENGDIPENIYDDFIPTIDGFTIDDLTEIFADRLYKIKYQLCLHEYNEYDKNDETVNQYYCKILLRNKDDSYFYMNKDRIPDNKYFTFVIRRNYKNSSIKELKDIYAICELPNKTVIKVYFDNI